jgi:hypothetical protein
MEISILARVTFPAWAIARGWKGMTHRGLPTGHEDRQISLSRFGDCAGTMTKTALLALTFFAVTGVPTGFTQTAPETSAAWLLKMLCPK